MLKKIIYIAIVEEAINAYQSECAKMELINQKSFYTSSPSLKMFLTIIND